jgi:hypothetical protein
LGSAGLDDDDDPMLRYSSLLMDAYTMLGMANSIATAVSIPGVQ